MSKEYVYKPIDLVELERKYSPYVVIDSSKNLKFINDSGELKTLLKDCEEGDDELYIYALQSVVRPQEIANDEDDENSETNSQKINVDNVIDEVTKVFNNILKEIVSKNK